jgi:flagellar biosynthesis/type III secretory pathway M-ring protein FliF/YscJ
MADPLHLYGAIGVGFFLLIAILWMAKRSISRRLARRRAARAAAPKAAETEAPKQEEVETPSPTLTPGDPGDAPAPSANREQANYDEIRKRVNLQVDRSPEAAAAILRKWLAENPTNGNANGTANHNGNGNGNGAHSEGNAA